MGSTPEQKGLTHWIYCLRKESLIHEMDKYGLDTEGSVDDLRRRFVKHVKEHAQTKDVQKLATHVAQTNNSPKTNDDEESETEDPRTMEKRIQNAIETAVRNAMTTIGQPRAPQEPHVPQQ